MKLLKEICYVSIGQSLTERDESVGYVMLRCCSLSFSIGGRRHPEGG